MRVDTTEIEPSLLSLAQEFFGMPDSPNHRNIIEDGRRFLHGVKKPYDLIFSDAYYSYYSIPAHLTTVEFFQLVKTKLADDGLFIANVVGSLAPISPSLALSEIKTFRSVFPNSYFFALESPTSIEPQNMIFVGYKGKERLNLNDPKITASENSLFRALPSQIIDIDRLNLEKHLLLTDNFAPVDYMAAQLIHQLPDR